MFIRTQFSLESFGRLILQRVTSSDRPCLPVLYDVSLVPGTTVLIRHVKTNGLPTFSVGEARTAPYPNITPASSSFQKNRINVSVPLRLVLESEGPGAALAPPDLQLNIALALEFVVTGGSDTILVEFLGTDQDSLLSLIGVDKSQIGGVIGTQPFSLNLLADLAPASGVEGLALRHADLALNPSLGRIELCVELTVDGVPSADAISRWSTFYAGNFDSVAPTHAWGVFFDQRIGATILGRTLKKQIDEVVGFNREGEPRVSWDAQFPGYRVAIDGEAVDACRCLWGLIDIDVRINLDIRLSLEPGKIRIDVWMRHETTDDAEVFCCALSATFFFPIIGFEALVSGDITWYEFFGGLALFPIPPLLFIAALGKMGQVNPGMPKIPDFEKDPADSHHLFTRIDLPGFIPGSHCGGPLVPLSIAALEPRGDGFTLGGPLRLEVTDPEIDVEATLLKYRASVRSCSGNSRTMEGYYSTITVKRQGGSYDFRICDVILPAPLNTAALKTIEATACPTTAFITLVIPSALYQGVPIRAVIATTVGGRRIVLPPVPVLSAEERQQQALTAELKRVSQCYAKSANYRVEWLIDPPDLAIDRIRQLWTIAGKTAERADAIVVRSAQGAELARVDTTREKSFKIAVFDNGTEVVVEQLMDGTDLSTSEVYAAQTLMAVERETALPGHVLALDSLTVGSSRILAVHQTDRITFFDGGAGAGLRQLGEVDLRAFEWIGRRGNQIVARHISGRTIELPFTREGMFVRNWVSAADEIMPPSLTAGEPSPDRIHDHGFNLLRTRDSADADEAPEYRIAGGVGLVRTHGTAIGMRPDPKIVRGDSVSGAGVAQLARLGRGRYAVMEGNRLRIVVTIGRLQL